MFGFGKKATIRKYHRLLGPELAKRYGGASSYSHSQVQVTIDDLNLNTKHINFAYLMFCDSKTLDPKVFTSFATSKISKIITTAFGGGFVGAAADSFAGGGAGDGGGGGE